MLQSKRLQRVGQDSATEQQQPAVCKEPNVKWKTRSQHRVMNSTLGVSPGSGTKDCHISTALSADHQGTGSFLCLRPCWAPYHCSGSVGEAKSSLWVPSSLVSSHRPPGLSLPDVKYRDGGDRENTRTLSQTVPFP